MDFTKTSWPDVFMVITNLLFLIPFGAALEVKEYILAWVFFTMVWVSGSYHLCKGFDACLFHYHTHFYLDFFFAQLIALLMILFLVFFTPKYQWLKIGLNFLAAAVVAITLVFWEPSTTIQLILIGSAFVLVIIYWIIYACTIADRRNLPKYNWKQLLMAIIMIGASLLLFVTQDIWVTAYWLTHSLWHSAAAFGQYFFMYIKTGNSANKRKRKTSINKKK